MLFQTLSGKTKQIIIYLNKTFNQKGHDIGFAHRLDEVNSCLKFGEDSSRRFEDMERTRFGTDGSGQTDRQADNRTNIQDKNLHSILVET